ncbi:MAG: phage tail protein [Ruminococcus sp.]|nr:phage tail protein [Ruminococcus sp.]
MYDVYAVNGSQRTKLHDGDPSSRLKVLGGGKEAVNIIDGFEFTMYPDNPGYNGIVPMKTMIEVYRTSDGKRRFRGRVLKPKGDMQQSGLASRTYLCESELSYLWDSVQGYHTANGAVQMFTMMLADHNAQQPEEKRIYLGQMLVTSEARQHTWHYIKTMQAIQDYIRDYGGEIRLRYGEDGRMYLDYTSTVWDAGSDTKIELAVNMQSVSWTYDPTQVCSGVYAVGAKLTNDGTSAQRLELGEVIWDNALVEKYGEIVAVVEWDDVTLESNLRRKAGEWLASQSGELNQYTVTAVDLSKIDKSFDEFTVGTQYAVKNPLIGLDDVIRCIGKTWSLNDISRDQLTFGDRYETLTALTSAKARLLNTKIDKTASEITASQEAFAQQIVQTQTDLLRGAEGGYRYDRLDDNGKPIETFYLNSPSIATATQALRINRNGIGFWRGTAGGAVNGTYTSAWTIDGTFNTAYIVGRAITGFTFNNGDGTFIVTATGSCTANDIKTNNITITGGSIDIETSSETSDKIKLSHNEWSIALSPLQWVLENTTNGTKILAQAGGIFVYKSNKQKLYIGQDHIYLYDASENVKTQIDYDGAVFGGDIQVKSGTYGNTYLVGDALKALFDRTGGV